MDNKSQRNYNQTLHCLENQYSKFSPIPSMPKIKIDGKATLDENFADNSGIKIAYNAFKIHESQEAKNGVSVPSSVFELVKYTPDQQFFISSVQFWCEPEPDDDDTALENLVIDPHSPAKYRVLGSLQNFPAFRDAFNCKVGSTYASTEQKRCKIWE